MTISTREDLYVLDIGPPAWCWSRLASTTEATLSFATARGRVTVDVRYSVCHDQIDVVMPTLDAVGWGAAGGSATLKITGWTDDQLRWSVRATGCAHRAGDHLRHASDGRPGSRAAARPAWLALSSPQVRGHYETVALDGLPPLPGPGSG